MKLVKLLTIGCIALAMLVLVGCSDSGSGVKTSVRGVVKASTTGAPLMGAKVSVGVISAITDVNGMYSLAVPIGNKKVVKAEANGYGSVIDVINVVADSVVDVDFALKTGITSNFTAMSTNERSFVDSLTGTTVKFPAGSVVNPLGIPVANATVVVSTSMPNENNYADNFPGLFIGTTNGIDAPIESFGFITVDIESGGVKCNLGTGKTADIAIPVAAGTADPGTPTIPLWSLDEATGKWISEGVATRDDTGSPVVYRATVTHFSAYNLDRPISDAIPLTIKVMNGTSLVKGASIVATKTSAPAWEGRGVTGANGTFKFSSVPGGTNSIVATLGDLKGVLYAYDIVGGEGSATINLVKYVKKTIKVFYTDGVKTIANGAKIISFSEGVQGGVHSYSETITDAQGNATWSLIPTTGSYNINCTFKVGGVDYKYSADFTKFSDIPSEITLVP